MEVEGSQTEKDPISDQQFQSLQMVDSSHLFLLAGLHLIADFPLFVLLARYF